VSHLTEIAARLEALGLGYVSPSTGQAPIKIGRLPASPDVACAVYPAGGIAPEMGFGDTTERISKPIVQVVFRGVAHDFDGPYARALAAKVGLLASQASTLGSTFYHSFTPQQSEPFELKRDELHRVLIAMTYLVEKDPSA
jgi:hypothetical protein